MVRCMAGIIIWLCMIPFLLGLLVLSFTDRKEETPAECMVTGYIAMFAVCQMIAVPMILLEMTFHMFCAVLACVYVALAAAGLFRKRACILGMLRAFAAGLFHHAWTVYAAVAAVAVQAYYYIQYMVTNLDDAYFVAVATTALETNTMYRYSPYTGRAVTGWNLRYCLSPFSMLQAFFSKCMDIHPSTLDHTVLAPMLVIVAYLVYVLMGKELFAAESDGKGSRKEQEKMTGLFLLFLSMVHVTSYYCMRNQGSVLLVRIWQGKATLAAVWIPFLFYHCYRMARKPEEKGNVGILVLTAFACCLVSSMGIALPIVMMGLFALLFGLFQKNLRYMRNMIVGALPCVLYGSLYVILKALQ